MTSDEETERNDDEGEGAVPPSPPPRSGLLGKLLLLGFIVLAGLAAAEGYLRYYERHAPAPYPVTCWRPELYQFHAPYGYRLWPSRTTTYEYPRDDPRTLTVVSNADGFRSRREFGPRDEPHYLVVGDSFTFGEGVEHEERFSNLIESVRPQWRVDNLGMTGWGPDLMLRAFETVGLAMKPDVVVLCLYTDDFRRVVPHFAGAGFEIPRFELRDGKLVSVPYPRPHVLSRFHLFRFLQDKAWAWSRSEWKINEAILDRFRALAAQHGFELAIAFLPRQGEADFDRERRRWLAEYTKRFGIPYADVSDPVFAAMPGSFIKNNWHYSPAGHEIVAKQLLELLDEMAREKAK